MRHRDKIALEKIVSEISIALDMLSDISFDKFNSDEIIKRAICMTVINIGELVKSLSDELRAEYKSVPWKSIAGFRDIAAHKYQTLKMGDVYKTVSEDFPELKENIQQILKTADVKMTE